MTIVDELLVAADRNIVGAWRAVLAGSPTPGEAREGAVTLLSSGLPVPLFNPAFVAGAVNDPEVTVRRIVDHYASRGAPFAVYFRDEVAPGLAEACDAAGLLEHWRPALMVLAPIPPTDPSAMSDLRIRRVTTHTVDDYAAVLSAGFGLPSELADLLFGTSLLGIAGLSAFIGTVQGEPVGSAAVFVSDGVAGIYNIATVPSRRGKGIGEAMTWAAVKAGEEAGMTCAILQASAQGEPVYQRMGFETPSRYRQFEPAGGSS
jgi:ribosomal protein S18 acetylase RimI-like enzyme